MFLNGVNNTNVLYLLNSRLLYSVTIHNLFEHPKRTLNIASSPNYIFGLDIIFIYVVFIHLGWTASAMFLLNFNFMN